MTPKERAAMQQALDALEALKHEGNLRCMDDLAALATLREALEQPDEIDWIETNKSLAKEIIELKKQAEQEPVAYTNSDQLGYLKDPLYENAPMAMWSKPFDKRINVSLYAAPVRTKDLTDEEAQKLWHDTSSIVPMWAHHLHFARAVIAAYKEKNK